MSSSDTTVIEGGRERKHSWDLKSFILGDTLQLITPLPRTGMFSKIWRAILVEVAGPKAPHSIIPKTLHLLRTMIHFYKTPPSRGHVLYLIGEMKSSSSSSNYPFANLKSFNRTAKKGKQTIIYPVAPRSQADIRSWLVYSKCQQYKWA